MGLGYVELFLDREIMTRKMSKNHRCRIQSRLRAPDPKSVGVCMPNGRTFDPRGRVGEALLVPNAFQPARHSSLYYQ